MKPKTLNEAVGIVLAKIEEAGEIEDFINIPEDALTVATHHGLGRKIRNEFGLWIEGSELMKNLGAENPDYASGVIIKKAWHEARAKHCVIIEKENQADESCRASSIL